MYAAALRLREDDAGAFRHDRYPERRSQRLDRAQDTPVARALMNGRDQRSIDLEFIAARRLAETLE